MRAGAISNFFLFRRVRNLKLRSKLILVLALGVLIPGLFAFFFFYRQVYDMVVANTIRMEQDAAARTVPQIDAVVEGVRESAERLTELPFCRHLFGDPLEESVAELLETDVGRQFFDDAQALIEGSPLTGVRIFIDLPKEELLPKENGRAADFFSTVEDARTYWRGIFQSTGSRELYCPPFYLGETEMRTSGDEAYIRRMEVRYRDGTRTAYVACYYPSAAFRDILTENQAFEEGVSYIINDRDSIVASADESLSGMYWLSYQTIGDFFLSSSSYVRKTILGKNVYVCLYSIRAPRWFMVTILPERAIIAAGNQLMLRFSLIYLLFLVLAVILANLLAGSLTGRIFSVIRQMRTAREGPPVPMEQSTVGDEIGDLIDTYNYMTGKISRLMEQQAMDAEELRIAEFNALQAQINPHFLYNTMDMINWLAKQGQTEKISEAVQALSRFYRLTLSRRENITTIAKEAEHITIYVHLQNMRFSDGISLICDIPDELMDNPIPKLTLQPVIENAILHGIREKAEKTGTIVLTGWIEDGDIVLLISDDGVGIPKEKLRTILCGGENGVNGGSNIAVCNTHRRLQVLYGERYGLSYKSEAGRGTEVEIRLPLTGGH